MFEYFEQSANLNKFVVDKPHIKAFDKVDTIKTGHGEYRLQVSLSSSNECYYNDFSIWIHNPEEIPPNAFIKQIDIEINDKRVDRIVNVEIQHEYFSKLYDTNPRLQQGKYMVIPLYGILRNDSLYDWRNEKIVVKIEMVEGHSYSIDDFDIYAYKYAFLNKHTIIAKPAGHLFYTNEFTGGEKCKSKHFRMRIDFKTLLQSIYLWPQEGTMDRSMISQIILQFNGRDVVNTTVDQLDYLSRNKSEVVVSPSSPVVIKFTDLGNVSGAIDCNSIESIVLTLYLKEECECVFNVVGYGLNKL